MFKKLLLIVMTIIVTMPSMVIDLSSLRVQASGYEVIRNDFNDNPVRITGNIPVHNIIEVDSVKYWVSSEGLLLEINKEIQLNGSIKRHDYLNETPAHNYEAGQPKGPIAERFAEIKSMILNPMSRINDRNGWSGFVKACTETDIWEEAGRHNTTDSDKENEYLPTEAEWTEFYETLSYNTPLEETSIGNFKGRAAAEYAKVNNLTGNPIPSQNIQLTEYNQSIIYKKATDEYLGVTGLTDEGEFNAAQQINCEVGDELVYYNDLDFFFHIAFEIPETPTTTIPGCVPTTVGECCPNPAWVAANPEQALIDCPGPPNCVPTSVGECCPNPAWVAANPDADCGDTECTPGEPGCCPQTDPDCHPDLETGCPNHPKPGEICTPDTDKQGDKTTFETVPRTYAELKEGTVYGEQWDAMAGVPTTKELYYGIGGNEYMVKVELELVRSAMFDCV